MKGKLIPKVSGTRKKISVSALAYFASRPNDYVDKEGAAWNPKAAERGTMSHNEFGRLSKFSVVLVFGSLFFVASILLAFIWPSL